MPDELPPIPFNKPFIAGKELYYIAQAVTFGNLAGDGEFTQRCCHLIEERFNVSKALLTPSCTAALEMAAILLDLGPGDEVIMPSYTFVSTALAVTRTGATPVFVDITDDTLNIDQSKIEAAITGRTKAIFVVHYAGVACEMDAIMEIARAHNLFVVEDAAHACNAWYQKRACGSIGHLGCFSFHETKNYIAGEGGALLINDHRFIERAQVIRDKGTNRQAFFRGEVDKYTWVDTGSSYVPSEICSAFLFAQLEAMDEIRSRRGEIYSRYDQELQPFSAPSRFRQPSIPQDRRQNFHMYYLIFANNDDRDTCLQVCRDQKIKAVFHYIPLHNSEGGRRYGRTSGALPVTESVSARLLRLPLYYSMTPDEQARVVAAVSSFASRRNTPTAP